MQKYIMAWRSNEPDDIRALFTPDAVYATSPNEPEPWRGPGADRGALAGRA